MLQRYETSQTPPDRVAPFRYVKDALLLDTGGIVINLVKGGGLSLYEGSPTFATLLLKPSTSNPHKLHRAGDFRSIEAVVLVDQGV